MNQILDAHIHSVFSDGKLEIKEIAKIAKQKGYKIGISDHAGTAGTMSPLNNEVKITNYLSFLNNYNVYKSLELNINEEFPLSKKILDSLDYRIGGVHFEGETLVGITGITTADPESFIKKIISLILKAIEEEKIDILSHPTCLPNSIKKNAMEFFNEKRATRIIEAAIEHNVALEINNLFEVPHQTFLQKALEMGATFSFGSDGHRKEAVCDLSYPLKMAEKLGIPDKQIFKLKER